MFSVCHIQSTFFEILFWLKPYFNLINYEYQQSEWVERDGERYILRMTPSASSSSTKTTNLIINLSQGREGDPPHHTLTVTHDLCVAFHLSLTSHYAGENPLTYSASWEKK